MNNRIAFDSVAGIVLVGTHPWNQSAFDRLVPRALLPVAHRPLISYALSWLAEAGIGHASVCANRETRALRDRVRRHVPAGMTLSYHEDPMPRGPGGSVKDAAFRTDADVLVVVDGTAIPTVGLPELLAAHRESGADVTVAVQAEPHPNGSGTTQAPSGVYVFNRSVLEAIPPTGFYDIKESLIPSLYRTGRRVMPYLTSTPSPRVLDATTYLAVNEWTVEQQFTAAAAAGYTRRGDALVHGDALIADDAVLVGPVLVGPGVRVMSGAAIVGPSSIGRDATIRPDAFVSRSAVWRRCVIGERAVIDRCIVADDAAVAADAHAFRAVVVATARSRSSRHGNSLAQPREQALETYKRIVRGFVNPGWSRSPVAP